MTGQMVSIIEDRLNFKRPHWAKVEQHQKGALNRSYSTLVRRRTVNTTTTMPIIAPAALHPEHISPHPLERLYYRFPHVQRGLKSLGSSIGFLSSTMPLIRCQVKLEALS